MNPDQERRQCRLGGFYPCHQCALVGECDAFNTYEPPEPRSIFDLPPDSDETDTDYY